MPSEELNNAKEHLASLEAFVRSRAHVGFIAARNEELRQLEEAMLEVDPVTREDEIEQCKLRGERRCLKSMLGIFTTAVEDLKDRIADLEDEEMNAVAPNEDRREVF